MAFDLDDEELEATRKMHRLDKINSNDINIGSIENDMNEIEKVKDLLRFLKQHGWIPNINKTINVDTTIKAINNLLIGYERQKQINEEHQKINGELRTQIKFLEIKLEFKQWGDLDNIRFEEYMNEFIPKQKIKDLMKKNEWATYNYDCDISDYKQSQAIGKWSVLQELLQQEDKK